MAQLSAKEFKQLLLARSLEYLTETYVFGGLPYYFRANPMDYDLMRDLLAKAYASQPSASPSLGAVRRASASTRRTRSFLVIQNQTSM